MGVCVLAPCFRSSMFSPKPDMLAVCSFLVPLLIMLSLHQPALTFGESKLKGGMGRRSVPFILLTTVFDIFFLFVRVFFISGVDAPLLPQTFVLPVSSRMSQIRGTGRRENRLGRWFKVFCFVYFSCFASPVAMSFLGDVLWMKTAPKRWRILYTQWALKKKKN